MEDGCPKRFEVGMLDSASDAYATEPPAKMQATRPRELAPLNVAAMGSPLPLAQASAMDSQDGMSMGGSMEMPYANT